MIDQSIQTINFTLREAMLRVLPAFSLLTASEIHELANLMTERDYQPDETIVVENDLVDSVYIIIKGKAEVLHEQKNKNTLTPVAVLQHGESIGLNDTGFFSTTGKRTATVKAITEVTALYLSLKDLLNFLNNHTHLQHDMHTLANQLAKVKLIKQSLPFHRLSHERLMWLADQVEEISVPAGTVLFRQGDMGDCCYLIRSGEIKIEVYDDEKKAHELAVLSSPTLFGEATLITRSPRNASAVAITDATLFVLDHAHLSELIESEANVAKMFMTLMVDRSQPMQNPRVTLHPRTSVDGQTLTILKNPDNGSYFKLSEQGLFIWQQLNGKQTMQEITLALADRYDVFAPDTVAALISKLARAGFVEEVAVDNDAIYSDQPFWVRVMLSIRRVLESRIAIGDADNWLTKVYHKGIYLLFSKVGEVCLILFALLGFAAFVSAVQPTITIFKTMPDSWMLILGLIPAMVVQTLLHELGHAFATKSFGYEVHYMGVGWYWFGPIAFTDTSDMWLSTKGPRTVVNLAGICTDILFAGLCALLIYVIPNLYVQAFLWILSLFTYINAFRMLSPLQELDGYYLLMDLVDRPHLRQNAVEWLVKDFKKSLKNPSLFKKHWPEVSYWIACIIFLILVSILTFLLQTIIFKILNLHSSNILVSLAMPFFVVLISSLTIIADIRSQSE